MPIEELAPLLFWRFALRVRDDNTARLRWSYLTSRMLPTRESRRSPTRIVVVELRGRETDELLSRTQVPIYKPFDSRSGSASARGQIPFHTAARRVVMSVDDARILSLDVPTEPPEVVLETGGLEPKGRQPLRWRGRAAEDSSLWYSVYLEREGFDRVPLAAKITDTEITIDFDQLPGGERCWVVVRASNGFQTAEVRTMEFAVPPRAPRVRILTPREGQRFAPRDIIQARGQAWDLQRRSLIDAEMLIWTLDGNTVGRGPLCVVENIGLGRHFFELRAADSGKLEAAARVAFAVAMNDEPPEAGTGQ